MDENITYRYNFLRRNKEDSQRVQNMVPLDKYLTIGADTRFVSNEEKVKINE